MSPKKEKPKNCFQRPHIRSVVLLRRASPHSYESYRCCATRTRQIYIYPRERVTEGNNSERERFGEAENINSTSHPKGVGNGCVFSFLLGTFSFLLLAIKEKRMYKYMNIYYKYEFCTKIYILMCFVQNLLFKALHTRMLLMCRAGSELKTLPAVYIN